MTTLQTQKYYSTNIMACSIWSAYFFTTLMAKNSTQNKTAHMAGFLIASGSMLLQTYEMNYHPRKVTHFNPIAIYCVCIVGCFSLAMQFKSLTQN